MKGLRGTAFDVFGYTAERRMERRLIEDYRALVVRVVERLNQSNLAAAIELARAAGEIGGYGLVKDASVAAYEADCQSCSPRSIRYAARSRARRESRF